MPNDVSDEALKRMAHEAVAEHGMIVAPWLLESLLLRIRDMTAKRCVEACRETRRDYITADAIYGSEQSEAFILALFPSAAAEGADDAGD